MFPWSKRGKAHDRPAAKSDADKIADLIATAVSAYGDILEASPLVIFPVSKLPLPKDDMKNVLRLAWRLNTNPQVRAFVEIGYRHLANFREDISEPIDPTLPPDAAPDVVAAILEPYVAIVKTIEAEQRQLQAEFSDFKARIIAQGV